LALVSAVWFSFSDTHRHCWSIAHEAAGQDKLAQGVNRSNGMARRQCDKLMSAADKEDVEADEQGTSIELGQGANARLKSPSLPA
jgi:hypothetical protein